MARLVTAELTTEDWVRLLSPPFPPGIRQALEIFRREENKPLTKHLVEEEVRRSGITCILYLPELNHIWGERGLLYQMVIVTRRPFRMSQVQIFLIEEVPVRHRRKISHASRPVGRPKGSRTRPGSTENTRSFAREW
jgi:hypothetical protein